MLVCESVCPGLEVRSECGYSGILDSLLPSARNSLHLGLGRKS